MHNITRCARTYRKIKIKRKHSDICDGIKCYRYIYLFIYKIVYSLYNN